MKEAWQEKIISWWRHLSEREQHIVKSGAILLAILIVYAGVWSPFLRYNQSLRAQIKTQQKTLQWMQVVDKKMQTITKSPASHAAAVLPVALLGIAQKEINQAGLTLVLTQLKQTSANTIEMSFQKVSFDALMSLLIKLAKTERIAITRMAVSATSAAGQVKADLQLTLVA